MRIRLDLNEHLLAAARRRALERGKTLSAVVEEALAGSLTEMPPQATGFQLEWTPREGPLRPGIDLANRDTLLSALDGD